MMVNCKDCKFLKGNYCMTHDMMILLDENAGCEFGDNK